jgi:flagellar M-ring protein FliF
MATLKEKIGSSWREFDRGTRIVVSGIITLIAVTVIWGGYTVFKEDYATLFTQLSDVDAAAIVDALKRQKIPYHLSDKGTTITVPAERVHDTRLELMSSNVPLSGGVGFEIFDKQGLGATEQSQRVSYQRALQGELTRTISSLDNVKQVRVHLVLPESSLFKRDKQEASAAVTVTMKPGNSLDRQQIAGVQRLIAASVAGLLPSHVVITDQRGVTLSVPDAGADNLGGIESRLELQHQFEAALSQKLARLLDSAIGPGKAIISISVALSFDAIKRTTQDLLPVHGTNDGGIVRKREQTNNASSYSDETTERADSNSGRRSNSTTEVEYEYGRRVEEINASPGAIKRITVGVVLPPGLTDEQMSRIRELVQAAAGIDQARGDVISVQTLGQVNDKPNLLLQHDDGDDTSQSATTTSDDSPRALLSKWLPFTSRGSFSSLLVIAVILLIAAIVWVQAVSRAKRLSEHQRHELLQEIRRTLGDEQRVSSVRNK